MLVQITEADGHTTVVLRQWGLGDDAAANFRSGWDLCLDNLGRALATSGTMG